LGVARRFLVSLGTRTYEIHYSGDWFLGDVVG